MLLKILTIISLLSFSFYAQAESDEKNLIPRQILFGNPDKTAVRLSYDGKYLTYIAPYNGVLNIWLAPSDDLKTAKPITNDNNRGIRNYTWAYDNKHILYLQDYKGDENFRVYAKNIETNKVKLLTPEQGVRAAISNISYKFPNEVLISTNERDKKYFDLYRYNLTTGERKLIFKNDKYEQVISDNDFKICFASLINQDGGSEYFRYENNKWSSYIKLSLEDSANTNFYGLDNTGNILYLSDGRERDTNALKAIDLRNNKTIVLAEDSRADVFPFTSHPTKGNIQIAAINYEKEQYIILDESIKDDIDYLKTLDSGEIIINSRTIDDKYWIVATLNDNSPVNYYQYDRLSKKAKFLFSNKADLEKYKLAKMNPVIIKSRDGMNLVSYITFPANISFNSKLQPKEALPMILFVHGGPWARDEWGYNPYHQLLANRGYVVLSVNYRGSTGFGKNFTNAGNLQWGKKMHDDLIDAVNWAITNKIAIPNKIAIMGGSYGGYATLAGLTLTPDVFACGVDIVGPSNLVTLLKNFPPYWASAINSIKKMVGEYDTEEGRKALLAVSPLTFVDKIKKPLFIAQGAHDPRVLQVESDQIVAAMKAKNIPVLYALYQDEGHGFVRSENRISFFALSEQFLAKILGGKFEPIGKDLQGANFTVNGMVATDSQEVEKELDKSLVR